MIIWGCRVHVILPLDQRVGLGIHGPLQPDHADPVGFDDNPFIPPVSHVALATLAVQVPEQPVPSLGHGRLSGQMADGLLHHRVHAVLTGAPLVVPVPVSRPLPVGDLRVVHPDDPSRVNALALAHRAQRLRLFGSGLGGPNVTQPRGTADHSRTFDELATIHFVTHGFAPEIGDG